MKDVSTFPLTSRSRINVLRYLLLALSFTFPKAVLHAYAEPCHMIGRCVGNIWYMHIPKSQFQSSKVFSKGGLPNVNGVVTVSNNISLLFPDTLTRSPYPERLQQELKRTIEQNTVLTGWGMILRQGSKVRILSYQTFPALGDVGNELFALILVISD